MEEQFKKAIRVLEKYEAWEAELIADNRCWEPSGMATNPRLTNDLYDFMLEIQKLRNEVLQKYRSDNNLKVGQLVFYKDSKLVYPPQQ